LTCGSAQGPTDDWRPRRRPFRALFFLPGLAASVTIALPLAFAQGIPNNQIPAITPVPPAKVLAPPTVPGAQYDCPSGYAKPDLPLRVQNLKVCLPVGSAGLTPSGIAVNPPDSTAAATIIPGQPAPPSVSSAGARTVGRPILACAGRTGFYACGRNAMECCPVTQDNPCFAGAYACKADASQGGANMVCCLR
jgi:hypothetical protein